MGGGLQGVCIPSLHFTEEEVEAWRKGSCPEVGGTGTPSQLCPRVLSSLELGGLGISNCDRGAGATMVRCPRNLPWLPRTLEALGCAAGSQGPDPLFSQPLR